MKIPWYIIFISGIIVGFLAFWQRCDRKPEPCPECPTVEIVNEEVFPEKPIVEIKQPEIKQPVKETPINQIVILENTNFKTLQKKYDSLAFAYNELSQYRDYVDSINFENLIVTYNAKAEGYLRGIGIGIIDNRPTLTKTVTVTTPPEIRQARGLYIGLMVGGNKDEFATLAPGLDYVNQRNIFKVNYNLIGGTVNIGVSRKLF